MMSVFVKEHCNSEWKALRLLIDHTMEKEMRSMLRRFYDVKLEPWEPKPAPPEPHQRWVQ